ncbi:hypothetical protein P886_4884 [Alteromonadaceae bacterium 2753L.S.0a.02]|nr:hypothetical protein P886_4884 [Alteromonadaceae bacterium 2753L.S.0a.02]
MEYTKPMIDLVREIRRRAPSEVKPAIKLANPELLIELVPVYRKSSDNILKALVRELMMMAGENWFERLEAGAGDDSNRSSESFVTRIYRGQVSLASSSQAAEPESEEARAKRRKRVYRGQVIA